MRDVLGVLLVWVVALYVVARSHGSVATASIAMAVGSFVALAAGFAIEGVAMRKSATLCVGSMVIAGWGAGLIFMEPGAPILALGLLGLLIVAATPAAWRKRDAERQRAYLTRHPGWRVWRVRFRKVLMGGVVVGLLGAVLTGVWNAVVLT